MENAPFSFGHAVIALCTVVKSTLSFNFTLPLYIRSSWKKRINFLLTPSSSMQKQKIAKVIQKQGLVS